MCGTVVCSQSYCCQTELDKQTVGACTAHSHQCGAGQPTVLWQQEVQMCSLLCTGTGLFLRVRECKIVLFCGRAKGCYTAPPYLDQYGETDQGLKRGNPLKLCPERSDLPNVPN